MTYDIIVSSNSSLNSPSGTKELEQKSSSQVNYLRIVAKKVNYLYHLTPLILMTLPIQLPNTLFLSLS